MPLISQPTTGTIGIDVSDHVLRAVYAVRRRQGIAVKRFTQVSLPPKVITNGIIIDEERAGQAAHELLSRGMPVRSITAVIGLPESHSFVGSNQQQRDTFEEEVLRHIPFDEEEVTIDSIRYSGNVIGFAAVKTEIAEAYHRLFSSTGVHVRALEIESQALARLYVPRVIASQATILVDIGRKHSTFLVIQGDHIDFTHTSKLISGDTLTTSIMDRLNLQAEAAERLKIEQPTHPEVQNAILQHIAAIGQELERVITYHYSHPAAEKPSAYRLLVTGGGAQLPDIVQRLEQSLTIPVYRADIPDHIRLPQTLRSKSYSFATAIGLATRSIER